MKIFLASFLEVHNFGPGRVIGIANGNKPSHVKCEIIFKELIPNADITKTYNKESAKNPKEASVNFVNNFTKQLEKFYQDVKSEAEKNKVDPKEILPFKDGDTLASWERFCYSNYRGLIAPFLEKLGYEVFQK